MQLLATTTVSPMHVAFPFPHASRPPSRLLISRSSAMLVRSDLGRQHGQVRRLSLLPLARVANDQSVSHGPSANDVDIEKLYGMGESWEIELKVRDYELDQFGMVNNAVYARILEYAHQELLESIGLSSNTFIRNGDTLAMSELSFKFFAPLWSGDKFVVKVWVSECSLVRMFFQHFIYKLPNHEPVVESKGTAVWLDKNSRPVRIPPDIRSKFTRFMRHGGPK